ncbi:Pyruvate decarboxylase isozyme 3 [Tritrichomonas foetus]|uniref:Pyruvate decarboxylase isozyme 3 n=1 Tax=Tritrichomonas foetus TaxID=1144522 RepID=A0A1J4KY71_9EUKA|nr:Pyruvate decarboxylase isozyme 3 [Tritrichomonas foetus]|eukprot:OHT16114.1 Pyruvate decarboxylase isozyme 3 [Tritrichomonas foetus]
MKLNYERNYSISASTNYSLHFKLKMMETTTSKTTTVTGSVRSDKVNNSNTVIGYLFKQIKQLGIKHIFGVPGDYAFPVNDAIMKDDELEWVGNCNELNATYSADGYARIRGYGAVCTTYGVGELCTLGGLGGAFAENVPIIHIVGMPSSTVMNSDKIYHHTLGNLDFHVYEKMVEPTVVGLSYLTPKNAFSEINRVLSLLVQHKKPVYFGISGDYATAVIEEDMSSMINNNSLYSGITTLKSHDSSLKETLAEIKKRLSESKRPIILPGNLVDRLNQSNEIMKFIEKTKIPFAGMMIGKACLDETSEEYIGMYDGKMMNDEVREFVESSDCFILLGTTWSDFNTGLFTSKIARENTIEVQLHETKIGNAHYKNVEFADVIEGMNSFENIKFEREVNQPRAQKLNQGLTNVESSSLLTAKYLYARIEDFLQPNDIVVIETGTSMQMNFARFPSGAKCVSQPLWGAIGWATPASFGAALAAKDRRIVLVTGEGAFQMTAQEICQFSRFKLKPALFIINNDGYLIERLLCDDPNYIYNDIVQWNYSKLIPAFGASKDFISVQTKTVGELEENLKQITDNKSAAFIEMVTTMMDTPEYMERHHEVLFGGK